MRDRQSVCGVSEGRAAIPATAPFIARQLTSIGLPQYETANRNSAVQRGGDSSSSCSWQTRGCSEYRRPRSRHSRTAPPGRPETSVCRPITVIASRQKSTSPDRASPASLHPKPPSEQARFAEVASQSWGARLIAPYARPRHHGSGFMSFGGPGRPGAGNRSLKVNASRVGPYRSRRHRRDSPSSTLGT
jgi:hypothetical protein